MNTYFLEEDVSHYLLWLKSNSGPLSQVEDYWEKTHATRMNDLLKTNTPIYEYFERYPSLTTEKGYNQVIE